MKNARDQEEGRVRKGVSLGLGVNTQILAGQETSESLRDIMGLNLYPTHLRISFFRTVKQQKGSLRALRLFSAVSLMLCSIKFRI